MNYSETDQAILLLAAHFSGSGGTKAAPLSPTEYGRFSIWLHDHEFTPSDLFHRFDDIMNAWSDPKGKITSDRLTALLARGASMGFALEKWSGAGLWFMTRASPDYPKRLKHKLKANAPPVLFGVGNKSLLEAGGIAIVGSRSIDADDKKFTTKVAQSGAREATNIVSGGAGGVDKTAMKAALEVEGTSVGVLSHGLFSAATSKMWRPYLRSQDLCLITPFSPESRFHVGTAMGRNKYIYCLADFAVVVRSDEGKGGTWNGATEALKKEFASVYVRSDSCAAGNTALLERGAYALVCPDQLDDGWLLNALNHPEPAGRLQKPMPGHEYTTVVDAPVMECSKDCDQPESTGLGNESSVSPGKRQAAGNQQAQAELKDLDCLAQDAFYSLFCRRLEKILYHNELMQKELQKQYSELAPGQFKCWVERALEDGVVEVRKYGRKKLYTLSGHEPRQSRLL